MCGRFTFSRSSRELAEVFRTKRPKGLRPRYNIAPGQDVLTARYDRGEPVLELRNWGWIPSWAKVAKFSPRPINARIEGISGNRMFRKAVTENRCLVPADGFYEWAGRGGGRNPFHITSKSQNWFGFAGLYSEWRGKGEERIGSFAILTCVSSGNLKGLHGRMPLAFNRAMFAKWLTDQPGNTIEDWTSCAITDWSVTPVNPRVNNVRNDDPRCILRTAHQVNLELFAK